MDETLAQALAVADALVLMGIAAFQVALAAGKPWGEYAWGGQNPGVLPVRLRWSSAVSAAVLVALAGVVLIEGGVLLGGLESRATEVIVWVLAGLLLVGAGMNGISRSRQERVWAPVAAIAFLLTLGVGLF